MSLFEGRYVKLNTGQKKAVDTIYGPVLVVAGPGSGKTELLGLRTANILRLTDALPQNILCLTFTEIAAFNMRQRLVGLIGDEAYKVNIQTFHGFGASVIQRFPEFFFGGAKLQPADEMTKVKILEDIFSLLPFSNTLSSYRKEHGYVYLKDTAKVISDLRRSGVDPDECKALIKLNIDIVTKLNEKIPEVFSPKLSLKLLPAIDEYLSGIRKLDLPVPALSFVRPYQELFIDSLGKALYDAQKENSTVPMSKWKRTMLEKDSKNTYVLKDVKRLKKLLALCDIYKQYKKRLFAEGYFDFDDMILEVIHVAEKNEELMFNLQEQFQFILVDEFQDTSGAQLRLLSLLTKGIDQPNVLAVGDDDQAVFSFQGAEIQNLIRFTEMHKGTTFITLSENYRSSQDILDLADQVIQTSESRIGDHIPDLSKTLISAGSDKLGKIHLHQFIDADAEHQFIAEEILHLHSEGVSFSDIAIITKKHRDLETVATALNMRGIPVEYERFANILDEEIIREIIVFLQFLHTAASGKMKDADQFLSELLAAKFWEIDRESYWKLSLEAYSRHQHWLSALQESPDEKLRKIAALLQQLVKNAKTAPAEMMLDAIIGTNQPDSSPLRRYYFYQENRENDPSEYYHNLSSLRSFMNAVREFRAQSQLYVADIVELLEFNLAHSVRISNKIALRQQEDAVKIYTAHKSKGLEFDHVFIIHADRKHWFGRGMNSKIPFPMNMPYATNGGEDEAIRLFFVAITRAERHLYFSWHTFDDKGRKSECMPSLMHIPCTEHKTESKLEEMNEQTEAFTSSEMALLQPVLSTYTLSVTHLNNFLDIISAGPMTFFERNLLRFPQGRSPSGIYGNVIHELLQYLYSSDILQTFYSAEKKLSDLIHRARFDERERSKYLQKGIDMLNVYYAFYEKEFEKDSLQEKAFKNVSFGSIPLAGAIDRMILDKENKAIHVIDFKTGKSVTSWDKGSLFERKKMYNYSHQLLFYKILIENSSEFHDWTVTGGTIEFVEPSDGSIVRMTKQFTKDDVERLGLLIKAVYARVQNLDFPDISKYDQSMKGRLAFEDDLLSQGYEEKEK